LPYQTNTQLTVRCKQTARKTANFQPTKTGSPRERYMAVFRRELFGWCHVWMWMSMCWWMWTRSCGEGLATTTPHTSDWKPLHVRNTIAADSCTRPTRFLGGANGLVA